jgi:hypothetical protein
VRSAEGDSANPSVENVAFHRRNVGYRGQIPLEILAPAGFRFTP